MLRFLSDEERSRQDDTPTEEEASAIAQAITALNNAVSDTEEAVAKVESTNFFINEVGHLIIEQD